MVKANHALSNSALIDKSHTRIMACTQIQVHRCESSKRYWHCFPDRLNKSLVLSVAQAMIECFLLFFPLGMAGTVYFLADLLEPKSSKFPAFEI